MTTDQIKILRNQIEHNDLTIRQISSQYYVSLSVLYTIKRMTSNIIDRGCLRKLTKFDPSDKEYNNIKN